MEILIVLIYGVFALLHLVEIWRKTQSIKSYYFEPNQLTPKITVVVCAHNEKDNLKALIPILMDQGYSDYEVTIVLDRCTDGSQNLIGYFEDKRLSFIEINKIPSCFHPKKFGISEAIFAAKGEWILHTDADCRPTKNWISNMSKGMDTSSDVIMGFSPYYKTASLLNEFIQYESFQTAFQFGSSLTRGKPYMGLGRNLGYRKSSFNENHGFGEHMHVTGGDDDLLVQALLKKENYKLILSEESRVDSIPKTRWSAYFHQKIRHFSVGKYYPLWVKQMETYRWIVHLIFWILSCISIYLYFGVGLSIFALTLLIKGLSINIVTERIGKRFNCVWLPFVDLLYVVILPLISLQALLKKNIKWK